MLKQILKLLFVWLIACLCSVGSPVLAETVKVGLEPFPPLINGADSGYTVDLLKAIEKASDLNFNIEIMNYVRAKHDLKSGKLSLIAHTPYRAETKDFYGYAQEISWKVDVPSDVYVMEPAKLTNLKSLKIGTPPGNKEFASELLGLPVDIFVEKDLPVLFKMLKASRIDAVWFGRAPAMKTIKELHIEGVHYQQLPTTPIAASMAVRTDSAGEALRKKIEKALAEVDSSQVMVDFNKYAKMPPKGVVK